MMRRLLVFGCAIAITFGAAVIVLHGAWGDDD